MPKDKIKPTDSKTDKPKGSKADLNPTDSKTDKPKGSKADLAIESIKETPKDKIKPTDSKMDKPKGSKADLKPTDSKMDKPKGSNADLATASVKKKPKGNIQFTESKLDTPKGSESQLATDSKQNMKKQKNFEYGEGPGRKTGPGRLRRNMERVEMLARPNVRRLRSLWDEKCAILPPERRDRIKSALEEDYFLSPEQTEQYFQALSESSRRWSGPGGMVSRKEQGEKAKELRQRQKWLVNFSAQVAYRLCDYIAKGNKELLVSNRLRSIADVVLERVAEILGEPKPSRTHPGRLARFMVAISDRIAVWIENAVYRADALEPSEHGFHEHMRLDAEKPLIC